MSNHYRHGGYQNLAPAQLFFIIGVEQVCDDFGIVDATSVSLVLLGQPLSPTRGKFGGTTKGTSLASRFFRKYANKEVAFALPTLTNASIRYMRLFMTNNLGVFAGRLTPVIGWAMTAADVARIMFRTVVKYNSLVQPADRVL